MYKTRFIWVGKTQDAYLKSGIDHYLSKIKRYAPVEFLEIKTANYTQGTSKQWKRQESETILKKIEPSETTILLDEKGQSKTSVQLAQWMEKQKEIQHGRVNFVIGGAFGLEPTLFHRPLILSLSSMTFTHQMVRLILTEQVYRAFTIMNGESYHHER